MPVESECLVFRQKKLLRFGLVPVGLIVLMLMLVVGSDIFESVFRGVAFTVAIVFTCMIWPWWTLIRLEPDAIFSRGVLGRQRVRWTDVDRVEFTQQPNGILLIRVFAKGSSGHRRPKIANFGVFEKSEQLQEAVQRTLVEFGE